MIYFSEGFELVVVFEVVEVESVIVFYGVFMMFIVELEYFDFNNYDFSSLCMGIMVGLFCLVEVMK